MRIIQRFGRIDRIGSPNKRIQLVNYWPDITLDEYINLKERVESRMVIADVTATGDDNLLERQGQRRRLPQGAAAPPAGRSDRAGRPEDRRLHHRPRAQRFPDGPAELREGRTATSPACRTACTPSCLRTRARPLPGVIFTLRNRNDGVNINQQNRLHPYYLVYVAQDGKVIANHTEVKRLLDLARAACKDRSEPDPRGVSAVQPATERRPPHGRLLRPACTKRIRSMIDAEGREGHRQPVHRRQDHRAC